MGKLVPRSPETIIDKQSAIFKSAHHITRVAFVNLVDRDAQAAETEYETAVSAAEESKAKAKAAAEALQLRSAEIAALQHESERFSAQALRDEQIAAGRAQRRDQMREHGAQQKRLMVGNDSPGIVPDPDRKPSPLLSTPPPPPPPAAPVTQPPPATHQARGWHQHAQQSPYGTQGAAPYRPEGGGAVFSPATHQAQGWHQLSQQSHYGTQGAAVHHPGGSGAASSHASSEHSADTAHRASPLTLAQPLFSHMARGSFNKGRAKMDFYVYRLLLTSAQTTHPDSVDPQTVYDIHTTATYIAGALHVDASCA